MNFTSILLTFSVLSALDITFVAKMEAASRDHLVTPVARRRRWAHRFVST